MFDLNSIQLKAHAPVDHMLFLKKLHIFLSGSVLRNLGEKLYEMLGDLRNTNTETPNLDWHCCQPIVKVHSRYSQWDREIDISACFLCWHWIVD